MQRKAVIKGMLRVTRRFSLRRRLPRLGRVVTAALLLLGATVGTAAAGQNMLANSSFEVGLDARYSVGRWYMNGLPSMSLDSKTKVDGAVSLRIPFSAKGFRPDGPFGTELRGGAPVMVEKGKTYTFSVYLKTDSADVDAALELSPLRPYDYRGRPFKREKITLGRHYTPQGFTFPWKRESITFTAPKSGEVYWVIDVSSKRRATLWVDALKFEEGALGDYAPARDLEIGLVDPVLGHIHDPAAPLRFDLRAYNASAAAKSGRARLRVLNDAGAVVSEQMLDVNVPAKSGITRPLTLDLGGAHGVFVAELTLPGVPGYLQDTSFSVLPEPRKIAPSTSAFGVYATPSEEAVRILARAGFHWTATLTSAEVMANWGSVESTQGRYAWRDADVDLFRRHGFEVMMNLEGWSYPGWAKKLSRAERTKAFARYVEAIVRHYRGKVRYFTFADEIHNKIPGSHMLWKTEASWSNAKEYAAWHAVAYAAAKRANPDCQIVLNTEPGPFGPDRLFRYMSPKMVDVLAANYYPYPNTIRDFKQEADSVGIKHVWAPGVAILTWPMYFRYEKPLKNGSAGELRHISKTLVRTFAAGADVFFHYTATYVGNTNVYSIFEHDSSLKRGGVQFAALAWLLDGFKQVRRIPMARASLVEAYRFDRRDGQSVFALWSKLDSDQQSLAFHTPLKDVVVYDRRTTRRAASGKNGLATLALGDEVRFIVVPTPEAGAVEQSLGLARLKASALPHAEKVQHAGRYALLTQKVQRGRQRSNEWSLWYDLKDGTWVELLRRNLDPGGPDLALDKDGLTLRFHDAWNGQPGHLIVGNLPSDLFWGERFWRSMPDKNGLLWQQGRITDDNLAGRMVAAKSGPAPPKSGLRPIAYRIQSTKGFDLALETEGEQPDPRFPLPGAWDIYVWRGEGPQRTLGLWRYVHGGAPRERDIRVHVRVIAGG